MARAMRTCVVMVLVAAVAGMVRAEGVKEGVSLMWGIADTTASVGRLFRYHIPGDAFQGSVDRYEVVEAGKDRLPSWLHFQPDQNVLKGIPTPADAGQVYLEVTANGRNGQKANDVFSISVSADTPSMSSGQPLRFQKTGPEMVRCKREEPETVATIVVDADLSHMGVEQRLALVTKFLSHMGLGEEGVKVVPAKAKLLQDDSALVTGSGDVREPQHAGVALSWLVGCGKVEKGHFPILQKLDEDSGRGVLGQALGHPVAGWRVTNTRLQQQQHALKRRRRQVRPTPTPGITVTPSTATDTKMGTDTMTHKVVVMSSPTFTLEPTPTQPEMPKTTTPKTTTTSTTTTTTTTTEKKPETVEPSKPPTKPPVVTTKTPTLPPTTTTSTTTSTTTTTTTSTTTTTTPTTTTTTTTTKKPTTTKPPMKECVKPTASRQSTKVVMFEGEVVNYKIPEDLFSACGVGGTSQTDLILFKDMSSKIPDDFFLQFDQERQLLRGLALHEYVGSYNMTLVASLKGRAFITTTNLKVVVRRLKGKRSRINHKMSMTIDTDYDEFVGSVDKKLDLANKVASVFGDENTSALTVTKIERGSVIYSFTNNTLSGGNCPVEDVTALADKLVTADGKLNPEALKKLEPWVLTGAATSPAGSCEDHPAFPRRSASVVESTPMVVVTSTKPYEPKTPVAPPAKPDTPEVPDKEDKITAAPPPNGTGVAKEGPSSEDDIWITTVVPAVVIVAILLIALLIACILYRKKRKGKMSLEDKNTFVNKGAPVIFPDELEDKPNDSTKPLLIEGSPPAPPPEYHRGRSASPESRNYHRDITPPTDEVDGIEVDSNSPLYQPPPPVTASSGKQARPYVHQPYRSQPPEIHP